MGGLYVIEPPVRCSHENGRRWIRTGHDGRVNNVAAHPSQPLVLSAGRDGTFRLWDIRRSSPQVNVAHGHVGYVLLKKTLSYRLPTERLA